jgi:3-hydroxyisobutyrate dehydrogenase-like beta-hydroxyacid dehydrogenase
MQIGFVGLGAMGRGMAANLVRAGFPTRVYDVRFEAVEELAGQGAIPAASAPEAAAGADIVCVSVFDEGQVSSVLLGRDGETGILDTLPEESIVLVHTTVSPEFIVEMDAVARDRGASLIDVAITGGGSAAAVAGELTFIVGGPDKAVEHARPALDAMASTILHVGPLGVGMGAKIVSNFLSAGNLALVREAERIATAMGLGEAQMFEVVSRGRVGASWVSENWDVIRRQEETLAPGIAGPGRISAKDLTLAGELARRLKVSAPVLATIVADAVPDIRKNGVTVRRGTAPPALQHGRGSGPVV